MPRVLLRLFMQAHPGLLARFPHHATEAAPGVTQGHHEQPWPPVTVPAGDARHGTFAIVDLNLFAGCELEPVELFPLLGHDRSGKALDAVVASGKTLESMRFDKECAVYSEPRYR